MHPVISTAGTREMAGTVCFRLIFWPKSPARVSWVNIISCPRSASAWISAANEDRATVLHVEAAPISTQ